MIVEDGNFIPGANSYTSRAYADRYFTDRFNETWNDTGLDDGDKDIALISATDYIENRFGGRFLGYKMFTENRQARNVLTLLAYNSDPLTITVGGNSAVAGTDFDRGASRMEMLSNIVDFFNDGEFGFSASLGIDASIIFVYDDEGIDGNYVVCTSSAPTIASFALTSMAGGSSVPISQRLSFPRKYLVDRYGATIHGVPEEVKMAVCEYAVRQLVSPLLPDPTLSETGQPVQRVFEKIGPIETETEYQTQKTNLLQSYPAADRLLMNLIGSSGGVIR